MIHEQLNKLNENIVNFANHTEKMICNTIDGLINKEENKLNNVIEIDEKFANDIEIIIDRMCFSIIAKYSPKALDMRVVLMIMKMNNDLERIADHAVNIALDSKFLIKKKRIESCFDIQMMKEQVIKMLKNSILSFIRRDCSLAKDVCLMDDVVDDLQNSIIEKLIKLMKSDIETIDRAVKLINITHNLERIADLSTNIAEEVYYINEGKVIKHKIL